jgi:hypothetical protein
MTIALIRKVSQVLEVGGNNKIKDKNATNQGGCNALLT